MRDAGLLVGESETPLGQKVFHERLDFMTQQRHRCARDNEVIRIANQVDSIPRLLSAVDAEAFAQQLFESVQRSIRQRGGSNPALRCTFRGGEEDVFLQVTRL